MNNSFWKNKRVLLTGHTGFKGSWLLFWLSKVGAKVCGISLAPDTKPNLFEQLELENNLESHNIKDICIFQNLKSIIKDFQPQVVFHLAAQPLVRRSYKKPLLTWETNVQGSLNLLEALKELNNFCAVVMVTTDKVYENLEWDYGYRENDRLGGEDPYSASKAAAEIAIKSWRASFCGKGSLKTPHLAIATARSGNVIGGGDWAEDRLIPDIVKALSKDKPINIRNPFSTRPWQHVLEPLSGYLQLAESLFDAHGQNSQLEELTSSFNFGPNINSNKTVEDLVEELVKYWPGTWIDTSDPREPHEAKKLHLNIEKSYQLINWKPRWSFNKTVERTVMWYKIANKKSSSIYELCDADLNEYNKLLPI